MNKSLKIINEGINQPYFLDKYLKKRYKMIFETNLKIMKDT